MKRSASTPSRWYTLSSLAKRAKRNPAARLELAAALREAFPKTHAKFVREADELARKTKEPHCIVFEPYYLSRRWLHPDQLQGDEQKRRIYRWQLDVLFAVGTCAEIAATDYVTIYTAPTPIRAAKTKPARQPPAKRPAKHPAKHPAKASTKRAAPAKLPTKRATPAPERTSLQWMQHVPDLSGMNAYIAIIRGPDDPKRSPGPAEGAARRKDSAPHLTLKKTSAEAWAKQIAGHMNDGVPRTLNRIGVEMIDKDSSIVFKSPFEDAVWLLVERGVLEYTNEAPVYFRKRKRR